MSSGKWRPFCNGLNVLTHWGLDDPNFVGGVCKGPLLGGNDSFLIEISLKFDVKALTSTDGDFLILFWIIILSS